MAIDTEPKLPLEALRARYNALGKIEEMPGERTALGRCSTFELFLENGPRVAEFLTDGKRSPDEKHAPALFDLIRQTWL